MIDWDMIRPTLLLLLAALTLIGVGVVHEMSYQEEIHQ